MSLGAAGNQEWGWLKTVRSVIHSIEHGMEPMIFWGLIKEDQGLCLNQVNLITIRLDAPEAH